jgi:hypothetical protein
MRRRLRFAVLTLEKGSVPHIHIFPKTWFFLIQKKGVQAGNLESGARISRGGDNSSCAGRYGRLGEPSLPIFIEKTQPCRQCHRYRKAFAAMFAIIF